MEYLKEMERLRLANAIETIANLCDDQNCSCVNCPLVVHGDYDDYCIFDCNNESIKMRAEELRWG